jgi:hypothetical protein
VEPFQSVRRGRAAVVGGWTELFGGDDEEVGDGRDGCGSLRQLGRDVDVVDAIEVPGSQGAHSSQVEDDPWPAHLAMGDARKAAAEIEVAARYRSRGRALIVPALQTVATRMRRNRPGSDILFKDLLAESRERHGDDDTVDFTAWDFEGLARCGSAPSGPSLQPAVNAFTIARRMSPRAPGLVNRLIFLLEQLKDEGDPHIIFARPSPRSRGAPSARKNVDHGSTHALSASHSRSWANAMACILLRTPRFPYIVRRSGYIARSEYPTSPANSATVAPVANRLAIAPGCRLVPAARSFLPTVRCPVRPAPSQVPSTARRGRPRAPQHPYAGHLRRLRPHRGPVLPRHEVRARGRR